MRIAYVKSGDVVAAVQRLASGTASEADDGGPDGFLSDLLRTNAEDEFLLLGLATIAKGNATVRPDSRSKAMTIALRRRFSRARAALEVWQELMRFRPQRIICGKCGFSLWISYLVSRIFRIPLIHSRHNWLEERRPAARLATALDNWIVRRADAIMCHGPYLRDRLGSIGVPAEKTFEFDSGNEALVASVEALGRKPTSTGGGRKSVVFIGRVVQAKGVFDLLEACARLFPEDPELDLVYVGDGPDLGALRADAQRRGLAERVRFLGRIPHADIGVVIREGRVVVTPTRSSFPEGRCMVVMEALAVGVPVIAPRSGPFPYLVNHRVNGLLYQPDAVDELADCVRQISTDEHLYRDLVRGAESTGQSLLTPKVTFSQAVSKAMALAES